MSRDINGMSMVQFTAQRSLFKRFIMALDEPTQVNQLLLLFAAFASFTSFISPNKSLHDAIYINAIYINAIKKLKLKERQQIDEEHNDDVDDNNNEEKSPLQ
eukprot:994762_1